MVLRGLPGTDSVLAEVLMGLVMPRSTSMILDSVGFGQLKATDQLSSTDRVVEK